MKSQNAREKVGKRRFVESSDDDLSDVDSDAPQKEGRGAARPREEEDRFQHLRDAKRDFLKQMQDPGLKNLSAAKRLQSLVEKAEQLASFLLTKHKTFE